MNIYGTINNDCIKKVAQFGYDEYHNICFNDVTKLSWGTMEWISWSVVLVLIVLMIIVVIYLVKYLKEMYW